MPMRFISVATCWRPISTPSAIKDPRPKGRGIVEVSQSPARGEQDVGLADASDERRKRRGMRPAGIQHLWVSSRGTRLVKLADRIERFTAERFARRVPMHHFRHAAATSMALDDPHHVGLVAALLGHGRDAVGERYYNLASSVEAGRSYQD